MATKPLTRDDIFLPVLAAYAHDEISIGRARELLHMTEEKIRAEAEARCSNATKLKAERDAIYNDLLKAIEACRTAYEHLDKYGTVYGPDEQRKSQREVFDALRPIVEMKW
jgi:hypothetical protein